MAAIETGYFPLELRENVQYRETFELSEDGTPLDLTGAELSCEIRASASMDSELLHTVSLTVEAATDSATPVTMRIPQSVCKALKNKAAYFDLKVTWSNDDEDIIFEGPVSVKSGPTAP